MDVDGDGLLAPHEWDTAIARRCPSMPPGERRAAFSIFDADGDGVVDFDDFVRVLQACCDLGGWLGAIG